VERGVDLTASPLTRRKAALAKLFKRPRPNIMVVGHFKKDGEAIFRGTVHDLKLEGLVAKHANSRYLPGVRTAEWVKIKHRGAIPGERFKRGPK
jgi:bifunctional non-homologous end joining protein LigD